MYCQSCDECQRHKSRTTRPAGPLHPLPVPHKLCSSIGMDFVGPLEESEGFDVILTVTCRLSGRIRILPTHANASAEETAELFYRGWCSQFGVPSSIVSDRDKLFTSHFWRAVHKLLGVDLKMSTAYHPETDGVSERSNKTAIQVLRNHVARHQGNWVVQLSRVEFAMNSTVNDSTGVSPFELTLGFSPRITPPLLGTTPASTKVPAAAKFVRDLEWDVGSARDNILAIRV